MSEIYQDKAAHITAPKSADGVADSDLLLVDSDLTHEQLALPDDWAGRYVTMQVYGTAAKSVWFFVTKTTGLEVDRTVAAAATGSPGPTLGKRLAVGEAMSFQLPDRLTGETLYLVHETDDDTTSFELCVSSH